MASRDYSNFGMITEANAAACALFGFSKGTLRGRQVDCLMPKLYQDPHRRALRSAATNTQTQKHVYGFGLTRTAYVVPLAICIELHTGINDSNVFAASFTNAEANLTACYVLTDSNFIITNTSSKANYQLALSPRLLQCRALDLRVLCPALRDQVLMEKSVCLKKAIYTSPMLTETEINDFHITCPRFQIGVPLEAKVLVGPIQFPNQPPVGYHFEFHLRTPQKPHLDILCSHDFSQGFNTFGQGHSQERSILLEKTKARAADRPPNPEHPPAARFNQLDDKGTAQTDYAPLPMNDKEKEANKSTAKEQEQNNNEKEKNDDENKEEEEEKEEKEQDQEQEEEKGHRVGDENIEFAFEAGRMCYIREARKVLEERQPSLKVDRPEEGRELRALEGIKTKGHWYVREMVERTAKVARQLPECDANEFCEHIVSKVQRSLRDSLTRPTMQRT
jgi:PAS domain S-box-containing protein